MAGVPQIAADLLHRASRQVWANSRHSERSSALSWGAGLEFCILGGNHVAMVDKSKGSMAGAFQPAKHLVILQTEDWVLNHRVDSALPGYLMLGARAPVNDLSLLCPEALAQLGTLLAAAQKALTTILKPEHLYIGRYGHSAGHALHFHLIPICGWVRQLFFDDPRYRVLRTLSLTIRPLSMRTKPTAQSLRSTFGESSARA